MLQVGLVVSGLGTGTEGQWDIWDGFFFCELLPGSAASGAAEKLQEVQDPPNEGYLGLGQQLKQVFGGLHHGGVEWDDVALVQVQVVIGGQILR